MTEQSAENSLFRKILINIFLFIVLPAWLFGNLLWFIIVHSIALVTGSDWADVESALRPWAIISYRDIAHSNGDEPSKGNFFTQIIDNYGEGSPTDEAPVTARPAIPDSPAAVNGTWTNREGKTITATLLRVQGDQAVLLKDGAEFSYPIGNLSDKDQSRIRTFVETSVGGSR